MFNRHKGAFISKRKSYRYKLGDYVYMSVFVFFEELVYFLTLKQKHIVC